jgi:hypothetical protein
MARIRTIKPAFFRHRDLYLLEHASGLPLRVAFVGLWTAADREGRFRWIPEELKLDCLPYDPVDFGAVLDALRGGGFIQRYEVQSKAYGWIPSWNEHQVVNNREAASTLPEPETQLLTRHGNYQGEGKGREGKGKEQEGNGTEESSATHASHEPVTDATRAAFELRAGDQTREAVEPRALNQTRAVVEPRALDESPIVLTYPTTGSGGVEWRLRQRQVAEWEEDYPGLDILGECRKALAWIRAGPEHRKTSKGMPKFLVNWFNRAVDSRRGGASGSSTKTSGNFAAGLRFVERGRQS